jgi:hypothetical protein
MYEGVRPRLVNALLRPVERRAAVVATLFGAALFCASASLPSVGLFDEEQVGDTPAYAGYGDAIVDGEVPYRDFYVEYPPGALPVFVVPALGDRDGYATRFKILALVLGAALVACVAWALAIARANCRSTSRARVYSTCSMCRQRWAATSLPRRIVPRKAPRLSCSVIRSGKPSMAGAPTCSASGCRSGT